MKRSEIVQKLEAERDRHADVFGSEWDTEKLPNDWVATIVHYSSEHIIKKGLMAPFKEDFEDSLIKAGAVIIAALEYIPKMVENGYLRDSEDKKKD